MDFEQFWAHIQNGQPIEFVGVRGAQYNCRIENVDGVVYLYIQTARAQNPNYRLTRETAEELFTQLAAGGQDAAVVQGNHGWFTAVYNYITQNF